MSRRAIVTAIAVPIAVVVLALAASVILLANANQRLDRRVTTLRTKIRGVQSAPVNSAGLKDRVSKIEQCLPELQQELNSDTFDESTHSISIPSQVSRFCSALVNGSGPPRGE